MTVVLESAQGWPLLQNFGTLAGDWANLSALTMPVPAEKPMKLSPFAIVLMLMALWLLRLQPLICATRRGMLGLRQGRRCRR